MNRPDALQHTEETPDDQTSQNALASLVKIVESVFPHSLYERPRALLQIQKLIAEIPLSDLDGFITSLGAVDTSPGSGFQKENWAICLGLLGDASSRFAPSVWAIAQGASSRPEVFFAVCEALSRMGSGLSPLTPEIVTSFNDLVRELPSDFRRCTNEGSRYAVGIVIPCALVRLLSACGRPAGGAARALRKYRRFIAGRQFIQSSMTILDLENVGAPQLQLPTDAYKEADLALRAVTGVQYHVRRALIVSAWGGVLVALWWTPLGHLPGWLRIVLSVPSALYFLVYMIRIFFATLRAFGRR